MPPHKRGKRLKVAIIGGGPAGLGAAIQLARLPFVDWDLYEKRTSLDEIGGGFSLQPQTWRLLEHNGAADNITPEDYFRSAEGIIEQRRNGRTGELLLENLNPGHVPPRRQTCRLARIKLQAALLKNVDQTHVHLSKKLVGIQHVPDDRIRLSFKCGAVEEVDLLIAADGISSIVRKFSFPKHTLHYNGQSVYRTIVRKSEAAQIEGIPLAPVFWKNVSGLYVFTCPLGDDDFEVTARIRRPSHEREPVSWGRPFDLHTLLHKYDDFCLPVQQILRLAARGETQEFALYSGPHLESVVSHGNIAFIGDAAHALLGNFGSGAGFALEDVYTLAKTLDWAWLRGRPLRDALNLFDSIRSPHYERLHKQVSTFAEIKTSLRMEGLPINEEIAERVKRIRAASGTWMFHYEIDDVVQQALYEADKCLGDIKGPTSCLKKEGAAGGNLEETPGRESEQG